MVYFILFGIPALIIVLALVLAALPLKSLEPSDEVEP
jgi:hypothetical protein